MTVLRVCSAVGVNVTMIFVAKGTKVRPSIKDNNLMFIYGFSEKSCVIPNKSSYIYDKTCEKVMKVTAPGLKKMKVSNVACFLPILFSIYLTLHLCPSKFSKYYF